MVRTEEELELLKSITDQVNDRMNDAGEDEETAFMNVVETYLTDSGDIEGYQVCNYAKPRYGKVNGYDFSFSHDTLNLFVTDYSHPKDLENPEVTTLGNLALNTLISRVERFYELCQDEYFKNFSSTDPVWGLAHDIFLGKPVIRDVRIFVLTSSVCRTDPPKPKLFCGVNFSYRVWDLVRISRISQSGASEIQDVINLEKDFHGQYIPCLPVAFDDKDAKKRGYESYLAIVPGDLLADLYEKYKQKLLQKNVRAFLQVTGKINKGIQTTIEHDPARFFAYNNGISATASDVDVRLDPYLGSIITQITDFQIVNGGQTTASIHYAAYRKNLDVSSIYVQMKLTVIKDTELLNELVPNISKFANTQNKVSDADLFSNIPFHVELEKLSRNIWTPNGDSHWYYERSRGQYKDELGRQRTTATKKKFKEENPTSQKLLKTDVARYENIWHGFPHIASLGAEKSFNHFTTEQDKYIHESGIEGGYLKPDRQYFCDLVAKAILYRQTHLLIRRNKITGYQQQLCTYTLAYLIHKTNKRINLDYIWREQALPPVLTQTLFKLLKIIYNEYIINPPPRWSNISEWCKRPECWERLKNSNIPDLSLSTLGSALISPEEADMREMRLRSLITFNESSDDDADDDLFSDAEESDDTDPDQKVEPIIVVKTSDRSFF